MDRRREDIYNKWLAEIGKALVVGHKEKAQNMSDIIDNVVDFTLSCLQAVQPKEEPEEYDEIENITPKENVCDDVANKENSAIMAMDMGVEENGQMPDSRQSAVTCLEEGATTSALPSPTPLKSDDAVPSTSTTLGRLETTPILSILKRRLSKSPSGSLNYYGQVAANVFFGDGTHYVMRDGSLKNLSVINVPLNLAVNDVKLYARKHGNTATMVQKAAVFYGDRLMAAGATAEAVHDQLLQFLRVLRDMMPNAQIYVLTVPLAPRIKQEAKKFNDMLENSIGPSNFRNSYFFELAGVVEQDGKKPEWTDENSIMSRDMAYSVFHEVLQLFGIGKALRESEKRKLSDASIGSSTPRKIVRNSVNTWRDKFLR
uniref:SGNH_hydro domain-containing protein n=1 Tax=Steinernema glaseri TaxID=37863 RepID=A0A1I7Y300_9BILA